MSASFDTALSHSSAWTFIVEQYRSDPTLTEEERLLLKNASLDDYVDDLRIIGVSDVEKGIVRKCIAKLHPLLRTLERFRGALDAFANGDPHGILALIAKESEALQEDLISFFKDIGNILGRLTAYERLFEQNDRFDAALCRVFEYLLGFCSWIRQKLRQNGLKRFAKAILSDGLRREASRKIGEIRAGCQRTESEAQLAGAERAVSFQHEAGNFFKTSRQFYEKSDNEMTTRYEATSLAFLYEKLAPISIDDDLDGIQRKRAVGTCTWIANQEEFKPLLVGPPRAKPRMLWISGKPGSGKTYLAGYITEVLEEVGPTAAFFCATKDAGRTDAGNILRTLCWQLLQQMKRLIGEVAGLVRAAGTVTRKLLRSILKLLVRHEQRNAYIVLDGVDECEASDRAAILDTLDDLSGPVCVIVLSRPESDIERAFLQWQRRGLGARLEITPQHTVADMHLYVMYGVRRLQYDDAALVATIVDCVTKNANGMFLYVRLMMDELDRQDTDKERRSVLEQLPAGIHALYDRSMDRIQAIQGPRRDRVIRLLQLALCAFRPLTVEELSAALAVQIGSSRLDPDDTPNVRKLFSEYCQSFLEINPKSDCVQVLHASVRDYLTDSTNGEPFVHLGKAHAYTTAICLTFINFEDRPFTARPSRHTLTCPLDDPFPFTKTLHAPLHAHLSKYPFLEYCATSWIPHLHHSLSLQTPEITIIHHPLQVLFDSQTRTIKWMELFHFLCKEEHASAVLTRDIIESWILEHEKRKSLGGTSTPPLASISAVPAVTFAMNGFRIIDERTSDLISPLQISFPNAIFLAELGQKWDSWISQLGFSGKYGIIRWKRWTKTEVMTRKPAHIAAFFGFTEFLKEQIDNGLDPNDIDIMDRSLLGLASWGESISNICLLLERGADINFCPRFSDCDGAFPLVEATSHDEFNDHRKRNFETANFLLDMGAKVESGVRALNPLHVMFQWWTENEDEMRLLERILSRSEDLDRMLETQNPFNGMNCLHIAAMFNLGQTIIKIINSHSKPKDFIERIWGTDGRTALHEACSHPQSKAGLVLLAAKADVNKTTSTTQSTALGIAAASRSDILSELIKAGSDINARDSVQQTPLHNASWIDWAEGIEQLVAAGALIDAKDNQGRTPLDLALNMERTNAAERLRKLGADESEAHKISKSQHDVHAHRVSEIYFLLKRAFGMVPSSRARQAPLSIIRRVVDAAELWIETSSAIHRPMITMQGNSGKPYLITRPVCGNGNHPIRKVVIAFASESCEGPHPPDQGEPKSWIWFDLGCKESWDSSNDVVRSGPTLVFNQLGMPGTQDHRIVKYADPASVDPVASWLARMRNGQSLVFIPMARHPRWQNIMREAKISVFTRVFAEQ